MLNLINIKEEEFRRRGVYLWRYFDLHKFLSFIQNKAIRFTRMDRFADPLEGVPLGALVAYEEEKDLEIIGDDMLSDLILESRRFGKLSPEMQKRISSIKNFQSKSFISCWFFGQRESMAMWNLYSNSDGVALRISANRLFRHFEKFSSQLDAEEVSSFYGGKVVYQDFKKINAEGGTSTVPKIALRKDESYVHEKEFRFVIRTLNEREERDSFNSVIDNLKSLNLKVVCHPLMEEWKRNNIQQILDDEGLSSAFSLSEIRLRKI